MELEGLKEEKSKVSLIVPSFNGQEYLKRIFDSILMQTYSNIQFIFVNDGSTDNTEKIVNEYQDKFIQKLTEFHYIYKENGGAASAVNAALKYVSGCYLCWADSDDALHPEHIRLHTEYLDMHPEKGMVMCGTRFFDHKSGAFLYKKNIGPKEQENNIFERILFKGIPCYPGVFMIRTEYLFDRLGKERNIPYHPEVGQNYQLLLPVAYDHECGYLEEYLYDYYIREDSHSRVKDTEVRIQRTYEQEQIVKRILFFLPAEQKKDIFYRVHLKCQKMRIDILEAMSNRK